MYFSLYWDIYWKSIGAGLSNKPNENTLIVQNIFKVNKIHKTFLILLSLVYCLLLRFLSKDMKIGEVF